MRPKRSLGGRDEPLGLARPPSGRRRRAARPARRRVGPTMTTCAPSASKLAGDREADAPGRARDDAHLAREAEIHGALALAA